jgi:hypothetical protein
MDFRDILSSLSTLSEATKETEKGRIHKADPGGYGRKYDTDEEGDEKAEKKEKKPEEKKGRGRPKKDDGDKKYDTDSLGKAFGVGKPPKKPIGKPTKKHKLKDWIEYVETTSLLNEAEQVTIQPAQSNTQVIKQGTKTLGTVTNPQLASQIKQSIGRGEMTLAGDEIDEGQVEESGLQAYLGNKKYGKEGMDALRKAGREGASKEKMARIRAKHDKMDEEANGDGALRMQGQNMNHPMDEVAPPGAKAERMVKHIKKGYAKDGKLTPKEKSIAYATAWKAHNAGKVEEESPIGKDVVTPKERLAPHAGMGKGPLQQKLGQAGVVAKNFAKFLQGKREIPTMESLENSENAILTEGAMKDLVTRFIEDLTTSKAKGFNINNAVELGDLAAAKRAINNTLEHGDRYKRLAGTLKGQLRDYALEEFGFTNYEESLEEADTRPELETPAGKMRMAKLDEPELSPFKAGITQLSMENDMKDIQFEGWEKQLNTLLVEGLTVSSSTGQQGAPDSVTISATDNDAHELLDLVRKAGLGVFGGDDTAQPQDSAMMSLPSQEPDGTGTEPEASPEVVGDGDDMLALIKKMAGVGSVMNPAASHDYEEEGEEDEEDEESDSSEQDQEDQEENDGEESEKEGEESEDEVKEAYGQADEGNAFTGALAKAKADGVQKGETMKVGGKTYPVKEDDMEEGNAFTGKLKSTAKGQEFELDGKKYKDTSNLEEESLDQPATMEEKVCETHGVNEGECGCTQMEESFANEAGGDAMEQTELAKLKALLSMGNDLHKMKKDQTVLNPTQVSVQESISEWKKLSGIK